MTEFEIFCEIYSSEKVNLWYFWKSVGDNKYLREIKLEQDLKWQKESG